MKFLTRVSQVFRISLPLLQVFRILHTRAQKQVLRLMSIKGARFYALSGQAKEYPHGMMN
jgi:hypothetical protein